MSTITVDINDLPARLDEMLTLAGSGADIIVTEGTTPRAKLVPLSPHKPRVAGLHQGAIQTSPDFDAPLPDDFWLGKS